MTKISSLTLFQQEIALLSIERTDHACYIECLRKMEKLWTKAQNWSKVQSCQSAIAIQERELQGMDEILRLRVAELRRLEERSNKQQLNNLKLKSLTQ